MGTGQVISTKVLRRSVALVVLLPLMLVVAPAAVQHGACVDLLQYWAAAKLFISNSNPYDPALLAELQRAAWTGGEAPLPVIMWNPPLIFTVIFPLAWLGFVTAAAVWLTGSLALMVECVFALVGRVPKGMPLNRARRLMLVALLCTFPPFLAALYFGQASPILLLGVTIFVLSTVGSKRPVWSSFVGGLGLSLTLIKPHLLYLVYLYLVCASWREREWRTLLGLVVGMVALSILPLGYDQSVFTDYLKASTHPPIDWMTPTIGSWLQAITGFHHISLRMLPTCIGVGLGTFVFLFRHEFVREGSTGYVLLLMPFSLVSSPYGWLYDQMVLVPGLLWFLLGAGSSCHFNRAVIALLGINVVALMLPDVIGQEWFIWFPLAIWGVVRVLHQPSTTNVQASQSAAG